MVNIKSYNYLITKVNVAHEVNTGQAAVDLTDNTGCAQFDNQYVSKNNALSIGTVLNATRLKGTCDLRYLEYNGQHPITRPQL